MFCMLAPTYVFPQIDFPVKVSAGRIISRIYREYQHAYQKQPLDADIDSSEKCPSIPRGERLDMHILSTKLNK